jgi:hypothetical protein
LTLTRRELIQTSSRRAFWAPTYFLCVESPICDFGHLAFRKPVAWFVCFEGATPMKKVLVLTTLVLFLVAHGAVAAMTIYQPLDLTDSCDGSHC